MAKYHENLLRNNTLSNISIEKNFYPRQSWWCGKSQIKPFYRSPDTMPYRTGSCHAALCLAFAPFTFDCAACVFGSPSRSFARAAYCFDRAAWLPIALLVLLLGPFTFLLTRLFDGLFNVSTSFTSYTIRSEIPRQCISRRRFVHPSVSASVCLWVH